ncbi:oxidoreductase [Thalassotalea loyana]|uniref:Oxidoreductase n=1 Tax=Thalassotalea loyana TaxID=280483 RepID=A0ABQ6HCI3_9GAMM|nr:FAD-binding oxidoreductase [Thalassotalea loyana]GLX85160.1 oxidoreductase [Thalassotalea loyana]
MQKTFNWLSQQLLNHSSVGAYFEPLIQQLMPAWRVDYFRAKVQTIDFLSPDTVALWLKINKSWPIHRAGQHIQLTLEIDGKLCTRVFTIASSPQKAKVDHLIRLVIKQQPTGQFTPSLSSLAVGDWINISAPQGDFTLDKVSEHSLFLAAGSGITPFIAILSAMNFENKKTKVHLIYYAKKSQHLLVDELAAIANKHANFSFDLLHRENHGDVSQHLATHASSNFYVCGPAPFYNCIEGYTTAQNRQLFSEHFTALPLPTTNQTTFKLGFRDKQLDVTNSEPLLTQLLSLGESVTYGCKMGICHQCQCTKSKGVVRNILTGELSDTGEELIQLCTAQMITDVELKA